MEPRGCIGDHDATSDHYTLHAQPQGVHTFRSDLAQQVLKVPESRVHVIAGDIGGSFGMKSAIFNEAPLVLLASKLTGRPVKWQSTRSEAFLSDAEARDNVTDAELALDKDGAFLGMRVTTIANMGAHLQNGTPNFLNNLGISYSIERAGTLGFEGAEVRFDRSGALTLFSGSVTQGQGHETVFKQLVCDRLGVHPDQAAYVQGDTDKVFFGQGTGGSRSATLAGSAFHGAVEKITAKAKTLAAHLLQVDAGEVNFADGIFSSPRTNRTLSMQDVARAAADPAKLPQDMEGGLAATS